MCATCVAYQAAFSAASGAAGTSAPGPEDYGLLGWSNDPIVSATSASPNLGIMSMISIPIRRAFANLSKIYHSVGTAGITLVAGQNFLGLYSPAGILLGSTPDMTTAWGSVGGLTGVLSAPVSGPAGNYWVAALTNGATAPAFRAAATLTSGNQFQIGAGQTAATGRVVGQGSGLTALPASFVPSTNLFGSGGFNNIWFGVGV